MVILNNVVDNFVAFLSGEKGLADVKIVNAYPYIIKPTILTKPIVAVSLGNTQAENISVGDNCVFGTYRIDACIYSPYSVGADVLTDIASNIFCACQNYNPVSIATGEIAVDPATLCYRLKCSVTFNDYIDFGGGQVEQSV